MKELYAITIEKCGEDFIVYVPSLDINSSGKSLSEAIFMAKDAICATGLSYRDIGKSIPKCENLRPKHADNATLAVIDVDFDEYDKKYPNKSVRKNCTIPEWLDKAATAENLNFSQILQEALKSRLQM